jgi:type I restriction enzyme R subunit
MKNEPEKKLQQHIYEYLANNHNYKSYNSIKSKDLCSQDFHIIENDLRDFLQNTQSEKLNNLANRYTNPFDEILKALKSEINKGKKPLWLIMRNKLSIGGEKIELFIPKAWKNDADAKLQNDNADKNIFAFKEEYFYNPNRKERVDLVLWLNGLPIIIMELKHSPDSVESAVNDLCEKRDTQNKLFKMATLYFAMSDTEIKIATSVQDKQNFLPFNKGLINQADNQGEYAVEFLYSEVLNPLNILKYFESFLIFNEAEQKDGKIIKPSYTVFPRYHQLNTSLDVANDVITHFNSNKKLGKNYLINHSAGSGKTYTIAWLSSLLHSLYDNDNNKIFDNIIIMTDRLSLDKNIIDDLNKFTHIRGNITHSTNAKQLTEALAVNKHIIVSTMQKFSFVDIENDNLKNRKIALLIDEAHRSQGGENTQNIDELFLDFTENTDKNKNNMVIVAFTATATKQTNQLFGNPFAVYSEDQAIKEGYILDVVENIITYQTLYNIKYSTENTFKEYPAGILSQLTKIKAFENDDLITYKSEIIVKEFDENIKHRINGKAKAMVVATSRVAGLKYFNTISKILADKKANYKVLYAFSDFELDNKVITEKEINTLNGEKIEDLFKTDNYKIMIVANKFQTGFDEPLLSAMFLDKTVNGVNAIQTLSRLNRRANNKNTDDLLVIDFTNNTTKIKKSFYKHREGSPEIEEEFIPDDEIITNLKEQILAYNVFTIQEMQKANNSFNTPDFSNIVEQYKQLFGKKLSKEEQKEFIALLNKYHNKFSFLSNFKTFLQDEVDLDFFAKTTGKLLLNNKSTLINDIKNLDITKVGIREIKNTKVYTPKIGGKGNPEITPPKSTIDMLVDKINEEFSISEDEILVIKEICNTVANKDKIKVDLLQNIDNNQFCENYKRTDIKAEINNNYIQRDMFEILNNTMYIEEGGIIPLMSDTVVDLVRNSA